MTKIRKLKETYLDDGGTGYTEYDIVEKINEIIEYLNKRRWFEMREYLIPILIFIIPIIFVIGLIVVLIWLGQIETPHLMEVCRQTGGYPVIDTLGLYDGCAYP